MSRKEHLTVEGLQKIVAIKAAINLGLSGELKAAFKDTIPVKRPLVQSQMIADPYWLAGFVSGEGCFYVGIKASASHSIGSRVQLVFSITQHSRDEELMKNLVSYLGYGKYVPRNNKDFGEFIV